MSLSIFYLNSKNCIYWATVHILLISVLWFWASYGTRRSRPDPTSAQRPSHPALVFGTSQKAMFTRLVRDNRSVKRASSSRSAARIAAQFSCQRWPSSFALSGGRPSRYTMPVVPPFLVTFLVVVPRLISGVMGAEGPAQPSCPILEHVCKCSADLQEFQCKGAGLERVPEVLPVTITKLWVRFKKNEGLIEFYRLDYLELKKHFFDPNSTHWSWNFSSIV